jgi:hypothetical protein
MFFRFGSALVLVVVTSLLGILVEKQNLALRREISRQHYRMDVLQEEHVRLRLRSQQLAAVERLFESIEDKESGLVPSIPGTLAPTTFEPNPPSSQPDETLSDDGLSDGNAADERAPGDVDLDGPKLPEQNPQVPDSSGLTTRRVPLLFWQKPVSDPRLKRGSQ